MTFGDIARWLWRRRDSNHRPRPSTSVTTKENPPEQQDAGRRAMRNGRKRFGKVDRRPVDKEVDGFVVPAEGEDWTSCSDSDESDWSVGWFEPLSSGFTSDAESDNSFAVLVPCYGPSSHHVVDSRHKQNAKTRSLNTIQSDSPSRDPQKYVEKWLASLKKP